MQPFTYTNWLMACAAIVHVRGFQADRYGHLDDKDWAPWPHLKATRKPKTGLVRAQLWRKCTAWSKQQAHGVDVLASRSLGFVFADNVKAGSSSIRDIIDEVLGVNWGQKEEGRTNTGCGGNGPRRTSSIDFSNSSLESMFTFSFVRDPVEKFESGVRQLWSYRKGFGQFTADELLDKQLELFRKYRSENKSMAGCLMPGWVDEHLQPSSWRLSGFLAGATNEGGASWGQPMRLDFIGSLETASEDWPAVLNSISALTPEQVQSLYHLGYDNSKEPSPRSRLSSESIKKMCQSELYQSEWACFGYDLPTVCK